MKENYIFEYLDEQKFKKCERSVKKYNMFAFKKLVFDFYPKLRTGEFVGELVSLNKHDQTETYELKLPTDALFSKVHGDIKLYYLVYNKEKIVMLDKFEPNDILSEGHASELVTYKGVMVSKQHADKDMFKINLLNRLGK